jgi:hypothetical protein
MNSDCGSGEFVPPFRGGDDFGEVDPGFRLRFILGHFRRLPPGATLFAANMLQNRAAAFPSGARNAEEARA